MTYLLPPELYEGETDEGCENCGPDVDPIECGCLEPDWAQIAADQQEARHGH